MGTKRPDDKTLLAKEGLNDEESLPYKATLLEQTTVLTGPHETHKIGLLINSSTQDTYGRPIVPTSVPCGH